MKPFILWVSCILAAAATQMLQGAEPIENPNRFSLGVRFGLNFQADFQNRGVRGSQSHPGAPTGGMDHTYDDGFVGVDSSGGEGGLTWNWGYRRASQVVGDNLEFHSAHSVGSPGISNATDDPQYGLELTYQRFIGGFLSGHWGFEAGLGYTDLDLREERTRTFPQITDSFPLNGVLPPRAGYTGTFSGPGPLLGDKPLRATRDGKFMARNRLSGQVFGLRLGPFVEWNLSSRWAVALSGGPTVAPATIDYDFSETAKQPGGRTRRSRGSSSETDLLYGAYASLMIRWDFNDRWGVYAGAQFQHLNDFEQSVAGRTARLDHGATVFGVVGASWKF